MSFSHATTPSNANTPFSDANTPSNANTPFSNANTPFSHAIHARLSLALRLFVRST